MIGLRSREVGMDSGAKGVLRWETIYVPGCQISKTPGRGTYGIAKREGIVALFSAAAPIWASPGTPGCDFSYPPSFC